MAGSRDGALEQTSEATARPAVERASGAPAPPTGMPAAQRMLALQRAAGNAAVSRLLREQGAHGLVPQARRAVARQNPTLPKVPASPPQACGTEFRPASDPDRLLEYRGEVEHFIVQMDFMRRPGARAEYSIPAASKRGSGRSGFADAVDIATNEIWEIKPEHLEYKATAEAARYVQYADMACAPRSWRTGTSYSPATDPLWPPPGLRDLGFRLRAYQGGSGAILYKWDFDKEFLKRYSLATLIAAAASVIKDAVFGRNSNVDPRGVPAPTYAPFSVTALSPGLREFTGAVNKELTRRFGQGPKGFGVSISVPEAVYLATAAPVLMADKLKSMEVQTDPDLEMARALTLAFGAAGASFGVPYAVYALSSAPFLVLALAPEAAAAAAPAATAGLSALGQAVQAFMKSAAAAASAGGLVFGVMSKSAYAAGNPKIDVVTTTYQWMPGGGSARFGDEVATPQGTRYLIGVAEA